MAQSDWSPSQDRRGRQKRGPKGPNSGMRESDHVMSKIFVGGLDAQMTDQDLRAFFTNKYSANGQNPVASATILYDNSTGRSRGFGFVQFANGKVPDALEAAIIADNG